MQLENQRLPSSGQSRSAAGQSADRVELSRIGSKLDTADSWLDYAQVVPFVAGAGRFDCAPFELQK
ncbi:MAG: hypothetical protein RMI91_11285 [Gemmatales bacterium]|nr:hypothetical protein [Gemmatales bacterium]MDW7995226.1 hypothetical protein [Gemmatales bacterium]